MTEISVGFAIVTPGSLDPGMHFGLEVKWLIKKSVLLPVVGDSGPSKS